MEDSGEAAEPEAAPAHASGCLRGILSLVTPAGTSESALVGRERELSLLRTFLTSERPPRALVLTGRPGIGKTTLWQAGVDCARDAGVFVLAARPAEAEAQVSFVGLSDLLEHVERRCLESLPRPQLRALEVALLRAEPGRRPPEPRAIWAAFLNVLRALKVERRVLVAVDDVQWLDSATTEAAAFAARRLEGDGVEFLLAARPGSSAGLARALEREGGLERIELGPLSFGAIRRLLAERLGLSPPRRVTQRVFELSAGNPLFALEIGRVLEERGWPEIGADLPVPDAIEELMGARVAELPPRLRRVLVAVALNPTLSVSQLASVVGANAVQEATDAALVVGDGHRVRPAHPLLAAAARGHSRPGERRDLHRKLADTVEDEALSARHLALAATEPDARLAATVASAAEVAGARGAAQDAVELAEHALRLTPSGDQSRPDRIPALAEFLMVAGEGERGMELLFRELERLPPGPPRARAHLLLSDRRWTPTKLDERPNHLDRALEESGGDDTLRATILARKARDAAVGWLERVCEAEQWASEALVLARSAGPGVEREALYGLAWPRVMRGLPIDDLVQRFHAIGGDTSELFRSLDRAAGERHANRGEVEDARSILSRLLATADERGEYWSYAWIRMGLCELELRAGEWEAAEQLLDDWAESLDPLVEPVYARARALLAAGRGLVEEALDWAEQASDERQPSTNWHTLEVRRSRATVALLAGDPGEAVEQLQPIWERTQREGIDPGVFPIAPDLVEALVEVGLIDAAAAIAQRLADLGRELDHPWALAGAKRCRALVSFASRSDLDDAGALLREAAREYGRLRLRFDRPRALLTLGRAERRLRRWAAARAALDESAAAFDEIGSSGWAEQARSERARVGGRKPTKAGELTAAERRVAELASQGLANKEIAKALFVSVHTVSDHLSNVYAKLGIRSRSQLGRRLPPGG
jgi:DNA-binding CsgD family transcriptional regulator